MEDRDHFHHFNSNIVVWLSIIVTLFSINMCWVFFKSITSPYGDTNVHCEWRVTYGYVIIQLIISILYHMNVRKCYMLPHNNSTHINMHFNVTYLQLCVFATQHLNCLHKKQTNYKASTFEIHPIFESQACNIPFDASVLKLPILLYPLIFPFLSSQTSFTLWCFRS